MTKGWWGILLALISFALAPQTVHASVQRQVPTLYLHGHHGGPNSMVPLMTAAQRTDHATAVVTATVDGDGPVHLDGDWPVATHRPLIKIVFKNNRTLNYHRIADWLRNVIEKLQSRYQITKFNIVAHSLGNAAVLFYELRYGDVPGLPKLQRYVAIAANFNGVPGVHHLRRQHHLGPDGRPPWFAPDFRRALRMRRHFPVNQVDVLNIYGNIGDGTYWDGKVLNVSSRSLKYLLGRRLRTYRTLPIYGPQAQHSLLRYNLEVAGATNHFLWP